MHRITIPDETGISHQQWQQAWNPIDIVVRYFVASFVLAGVLLMPLAWMVGSYALVVFILFPILGISLSMIIWRRACTAVNTAYQEVLNDITNWRNQSSDKIEILASDLNGSGNQYCLEPAKKYTLTYVKVAGEYTLLEEVTIDFANLETSTKSERIPSQQIVAQSFESGIYKLHSSKGIWKIDGLQKQ
ncbi:hypothetical protein [Haloarcula nitratireducens]|uniref:Uncharacterized protein n=1 Tax=Haloarcula nitratireducens TaxID=2487749 RepID=A0AAW4PHG0_9EURY|nr:hypothetical protein [Halomicroarcula nitratireducens]MBX0297906.1 hypothetical protein [Halomicroarcula nitratireducens]